ncbi:MAG: hypothetical protein AMS25_14480 [Gemmatimonas sp. SM23_52]|nr:MAG: hypothetical protein AMS25_14480 [Gemmatimonas sp. SM23_52]
MASVILALQAAACAATRASPQAASIYEADLGRTNFETITQEVPRILDRYRFPIFRAENRETTIYLKTESDRHLWIRSQPPACGHYFSRSGCSR